MHPWIRRVIGVTVLGGSIWLTGTAAASAQESAVPRDPGAGLDVAAGLTLGNGDRDTGTATRATVAAGTERSSRSARARVTVGTSGGNQDRTTTRTTRVAVKVHAARHANTDSQARPARTAVRAAAGVQVVSARDAGAGRAGVAAGVAVTASRQEGDGSGVGSERSGQLGDDAGVAVSAEGARGGSADEPDNGTRLDAGAVVAARTADTDHPQDHSDEPEVTTTAAARVQDDEGADESVHADVVADLAASRQVSGDHADSGGPVAETGDVDVRAPVTVCGNSVGVLGDASSGCASPQASGARSGGAGDADDGSAAETGKVDVRAPVTVCGNGVGVLGNAAAGCGTGEPSGSPAAAGPGSNAVAADARDEGALVSVGDVSARAPVTVCGNAIGDASTGCASPAPSATGGSQPSSGDTSGSPASPDPASPNPASSGPASPGVATSGAGLAGIDQVSAEAPVLVCGNAVGALGDASAGCGPGAGAATAPSPSEPAPSAPAPSAPAPADPVAPAGSTDSAPAIVQVDSVTAEAPVLVCGNAIGVLGDGSGTCSTTSGAPAAPPTPATPATPGTPTTPTTPTTPETPATPGSPATPGTPEVPGAGPLDPVGSDTTDAEVGPDAIAGGMLPASAASVEAGSMEAGSMETGAVEAGPAGVIASDGVTAAGSLPFTGFAGLALVLVGLGLLLGGTLLLLGGRRPGVI